MGMFKIMKKIFLIIFILTSFCMAQSGLSSQSSDSFLSLQKITVTIGGDFFLNGSFPALATERVDEFLTRLFNEARQVALTSVKDRLSLVQVKKEFESYSLRNIKLKRFDGTEIFIDLARFRLDGDFNNNPYLRNNDVIIIPKLNLELNYVEIDGAVNEPKKIQFVDGDNLSDAIFFAWGINKAYENVTKAQISRLSYDGTQEELIETDIDANIVLKRGDRIKILAEENQKKNYKVLIVGEVLNPGYVPITKNNTSIKQVIEKVGGFKEEADLNRAEIIRGTDKSQVLKINAIKEAYSDKKDISSTIFGKSLNEIYFEKLKMARMADLSIEDTTYFSIDNTLRVLNGVGLIDFNKIFSDSTEDGEFLVSDSDIIVIPEKQELVHIFGQVKKPGYTNYIHGRNFEFYIEKAGGLGEIPDKIWVVRGESRDWIEADEELAICPGDFIYVQKEVKPSSREETMSYTVITSAISALASLVLVIYNLTK